MRHTILSNKLAIPGERVYMPMPWKMIYLEHNLRMLDPSVRYSRIMSPEVVEVGIKLEGLKGTRDGKKVDVGHTSDVVVAVLQ